MTTPPRGLQLRHNFVKQLDIGWFPIMPIGIAVAAFLVSRLNTGELPDSDVFFDAFFNPYVMQNILGIRPATRASRSGFSVVFFAVSIGTFLSCWINMRSSLSEHGAPSQLSVAIAILCAAVWLLCLCRLKSWWKPGYYEPNDRSPSESRPPADLPAPQ